MLSDIAWTIAVIGGCLMLAVTPIAYLTVVYTLYREGEYVPAVIMTTIALVIASIAYLLIVKTEPPLWMLR